MERDSMGEVEVPADAYYGASTQRAVLNFPISGEPFPRRFIRALGLVKKAAAQTNRELGLLSRRRARAISAAAQEVIRSEEHTSELQSHSDLVCRLLLEKKKETNIIENAYP